jgi:chitin disaccharide deacetylase
MRWLSRQTDPAHGGRAPSRSSRARSWLIVNADDFGASPGVNSGILEAHRGGIVTSASLLVDRPWSREAAMAARAASSLSLGLHAEVDAGTVEGMIARPQRLHDALESQLSKFEFLVGRPPTHLDSHHDAHEESIASEVFLRIARRHRLALRGFSPVRALRSFGAGGAGGVARVTTASLVDILTCEVGDGVFELVCHPGHIDDVLRNALDERGIRLIRHEDVPRLFAPERDGAESS